MLRFASGARLAAAGLASVVVAGAIAPAAVLGQSAPAAPQALPVARASQPWTVGAWIGAASNSPTTFLLGKTPGRDHLFLGLQLTRPIGQMRRFRLAYVVQVLPMVQVTGRTAPLLYGGVVGPDGLLPEPERARAAGISPIGLELSTADWRRVSMFGAAAGGALVFNRPFPVVEAQRVNFTLEYGLGIRFRTTAGQWVQLGYKFHHLSNAFMARMNPGLDAHVVYGGYQWRTRFR